LISNKSKEFDLAISSVLSAGKIVREIYDSSFSVSWKAKDDPLTEADIQANKEIISRIQNLFPSDGILSEEITDNKDRLEKSRVWIIDPIDGTREFVAKNPEFSISLGLAIDGKPVLGVVFNPITRELMSGIVGVGVSCNIVGEDLELDTSTIQLSKMNFAENVDKPSVYVSRSEFYKYKLFDTNPYWNDSFILKPIGSIAYKLALTAAGLGDLSLSLKPKSEWDICAGIALILAAGGMVIDLKNQTDIPFNALLPRINGILGGNPFLVKRLIESDGKFFKDSLVDWN